MLGFDVASGLVGSVLTSLAKVFEKHAISIAEEKVPGFLSLSRKDEEKFNDCRTQLSYREKGCLTIFLKSLSEDEQDLLKTTVAGMTERIDPVTIKNPDGTKAQTTKTVRPAVLTLKYIARLAHEEGADVARDYCLTGGLISHNLLIKKTMKKVEATIQSAADVLKKPCVQAFIARNTQPGRTVSLKGLDNVRADILDDKKRKSMIRKFFLGF